jgi:hypothetical protein
MARRATNSDGSKVERRRQPRFAVNVPLEVSWRGPDNEVVKQEAVARQVNSNGGLLEMLHQPDMGSRVTIANLISAETAEARVLATPSTREGVAHGIAVELIVPSEGFWGVDLQVKKTSIELQKLEKAMRDASIDFRLLKEYREASEYVRATAGAVKQLRECQIHERSDSEVLRSLCADRIRRAAGLCLEVLADVESGLVTAETHGVEELCRSLEDSLRRLKPLLSQSDSRSQTTISLPPRRK